MLGPTSDALGGKWAANGEQSEWQNKSGLIGVSVNQKCPAGRDVDNTPNGRE